MEQYVDLNSDSIDGEVVTGGLGGFVLDKVNDWRDHYESNYRKKHDEYYRLWRGVWADEDKTRESERSRLIAPALQQAVESNVADIEEATFGRGRWFNITDDLLDDDHKDVVFLRKKLAEDFDRARVQTDLMETALISGIFGTGIMEMDVDNVIEQKIATREAMGGALTTFGIETKEGILVRGVPTMPRNFVIDPNATCIEDAFGCGTDRYVSGHKIVELQEKGVYRDVHVGTAPSDTDIEADKTLNTFEHDRVRLVKYYGLVPRELLEEFAADTDEEFVDLAPEGSVEDSAYVEAIVVIANEGVVLKAEPNPYMMQDRPIVAFAWDNVPSRFWGRGVCEKGYNSQKALDAELRARVDALALTTHPMIAMDASRMPRGAKPQVRPGKTLVTQGNPNEILMPFKFGAVDQITFAQAGELQKMVGQATGAIEVSGLPQAAAAGEATAAGMSMALGAVMKRHRRTLTNFQKNFVETFVQKAAWRYMQYNPEVYKVRDWKFNVDSTLSMVAKEYEVGQLTQILQTVGVDGPGAVLLDAVVETMSLSNSEELVEALKASREPNPEQQQMQQKNIELEMNFKEQQAEALAGQAKESKARAIKYLAEAKDVPVQSQIDQIRAVAEFRGEDDETKDFKQRMQIAELFVKDRETQVKERESGVRVSERKAKAKAEAKEAAAGDELRSMMGEQSNNAGTSQAPTGAN